MLQIDYDKFFIKNKKIVTLTVKNILSVKKRLGSITKVQGRVAGREHLLLNHPPLDPFGSKGSTYFSQCT
jgi:hypothetical protein